MLINKLPQFTIPKIKFEPVMAAFSEVYDWGLKDINVPQIHKEILGEGVKIAVVDSGRPDHFDVKNNIIEAADFTNSRDTSDKNSHSTFISGIIAAEKNAQGIIGVAPKAKLYIAKALNDAGQGSPSAMASAVSWSISQGVDIINISAGMFFDFKPLYQQIKKAYKKNIIIIAAVGNTATSHYDVAFPARYRECIGVAAYDKRRKVAQFSSRGVNVSFAMPGTDVYSCGLNQTYMKSNGTSFSAPIMTGVCALILSKHRQTPVSKTPCDTPKEMMEHLQKYAIKLNGKNETGFGTINLSEAIRDV